MLEVVEDLLEEITKFLQPIDMNRYLYSLTFLLFCVIFDGKSQAYGYYKDVLKFSNNFSGGSARIQGIGGASSSLGGDISSISINPAGLGFFNKGVFSITYDYTNKSYDVGYLGDPANNRNIDNSYPSFSNISLVIPLKKKNSYSLSGNNTCPDCSKFNFGISFNNVRSYNKNRTYSGYNDYNSIIDYFLYDAQGIALSQISNTNPISGIGLLQEAYDHYLINPDTDLPGSYFSFVGGYPFQSEEITYEGSISKLSFSGGTNSNDKIFLGFGLNLYSISYLENRKYIEDQFEILDSSGNWVQESILNYLELNDFFKINGSGASLSLGVIIKPIDQLNIGINFESKTKYSLSEEMFSELETSYFDYYFQPEDTVLGAAVSGTAKNISDYKFTSPSKISIGSSYFFKKFGFISADIDLINYTNSRIESFDFNPNPDNAEINYYYKSLAINYRLGIEARYKKFYFRYGYNFLADPARGILSNDIDNSIVKNSLGFGFLSKKFSLDFAYIFHKKENINISPYNLPVNQPVATFNDRIKSLVFTLSYRLNK